MSEIGIPFRRKDQMFFYDHYLKLFKSEMISGFKTGPFFYPFASGELLHCFFSTICYHLEDGDRGSRFPRLMNDLYDGKLLPENVDETKKEIEKVKEELKQFNSSELIWDIHNLEEPVPDEVKKNQPITDLSNYFYLNDKRNLFELILTAFESSKKANRFIEITSLPI